MNEIVCIEALHKDLCIKFGYIMKMAYCCGRTSLHCSYVKMCRTGEYACDTCSTHFYIIAGKGCSFGYLRNCIFLVIVIINIHNMTSSTMPCSRSRTEFIFFFFLKIPFVLHAVLDILIQIPSPSVFPIKLLTHINLRHIIKVF